MADKERVIGICALTLHEDAFVRCHLIPQALARMEPSNGPIILLKGDEARPKRRWTSWYDEQLVTRAGEDILARYDDWAVKFLRQHRLVWSSWDSLLQPPPLDDDFGAFGFRIIESIEAEPLRLFFHSLLWRAAASSLPEFSSIILPDGDMETLRASLLTAAPVTDDFYQISLMMFSTAAEAHIWAPEALMMPVMDGEGNQVGERPIFRFFMDGLVATFRCPLIECKEEKLTDNRVGNSSRLIIHAQPFNDSRQKKTMISGHSAAVKRFPKEMERFKVLRSPFSD